MKKVMFLTQELLKTLPAPMAQDGKGDDAIAYAKYFSPYSGWTWYVTEYDREEKIFFGLVFGFECELGYFALEELEEAKGPMGVQGVERDIHFKPMTLREIRNLQQHSGYRHR